MLRLRPRSAYDVIALLALVVAVGTGGAYAANSIGSADVIDESLLSQDIKNGEVKGTELAVGAVSSAGILDYSITKVDLGPDSVGTGKIKDGVVANSDLAPNAVTGAKVLDNSLTGADIQESTLASVPDANALGGLAASSYQRRVWTSCQTGIATIGATGDATCAPRDTWALRKSVNNGQGDGSDAGDLGISVACFTPGKVSILLVNKSGGAATLNWLYHDGAAMQASGNSLGPSNVQTIDSVGNRIEGQFILAGPSSVTTANLHAFRAGSAGGCELTGTAVKSTG